MLRAVTDASTQSWLEGFVQAHGGVAGTVHTLSADDADLLVMGASFNIPPPVVAVTQRIPRGKGMAGLALERNTPVQTCNLKSDDSGDVRPGAKAVAAHAAVALPVHDAAGTVRAVVGIAFPDERELGDSELATLAAAAIACPS